ncbi:hypothetical protein PHYBLDRAFT_166418 [Phycomyces blakesleeanus NRRL 1555(-)]|uniref:Uncharacterized protein n=1 Tax=Phycomyces blakesleeanus (strain ATCC 8743b / DSM 1359 / FGSC 10004 / NBRC 33097 / NRRL 1555) TaxID=763407 RepID=A0A162UIF3_PHYB8|nr:hypothetical protein PHYBLDRAFT_166418 [Phycomyces blakesleeanus NRRL 1555(-)]OAD76452.1 hypothetical protein PHYBLDRAFT_166418 [Phycomyces blakesleeanus NRRL 1555(-)]|eukprot:XP_018294492.1 hypothetical protein PHYBLDRAFT_166418 [Phycomyces blakesleeanus NRRL 1555(-)]
MRAILKPARIIKALNVVYQVFLFFIKKKVAREVILTKCVKSQIKKDDDITMIKSHLGKQLHNKKPRSIWYFATSASTSKSVVDVVTAVVDENQFSPSVECEKYERHTRIAMSG